MKSISHFVIPYSVKFCCLSILAQRSIFIPPENVRKPKEFLAFSGGIKMECWTKMSKQNTRSEM